MLILFKILQNASIANGCEAPHSTELVEVPVDQLPYTLRLQIAKHWQPASKRVKGDRLPEIAKPITEDAAIASLKKLFEPKGS